MVIDSYDKHYVGDDDGYHDCDCGVMRGSSDRANEEMVRVVVTVEVMVMCKEDERRMMVVTVSDDIYIHDSVVA